MTTLDALRAGTLGGLRELRLSGLGLDEVPPQIFDLADTLEVLDLSGNALSALPAEMGRLTKLRALFCSGNPFQTLPPVLGDCAALSQIGFRGCGIEDVPAESLPPLLRWLTLTDNKIAALPDAIGARPGLRKLMLAGNRLDHLPDSLENAAGLELLRLSANRFEKLPAWLFGMPNLAWLAWSGNAFDAAIPAPRGGTVDWRDLEPGAFLGEGASGRIYEARWRSDASAPPVALKMFKGSMTSDGPPSSEIAACLAAGAHPHLVGALGRLVGHPQAIDGLLMPLFRQGWRVLAGPPSLETCSRDVYDPRLSLDIEVALRIACGVGAGATHLHGTGLLHGDLYAHNTLWDGTTGDAVLSDLGNAIRHARSTSIRLTVREGTEGIVLRIADNGIGMTSTRPGFGLSGMRERVEALCGAFTLTTSASGTRLDIFVPLDRFDPAPSTFEQSERSFA